MKKIITHTMITIALTWFSFNSTSAQITFEKTYDNIGNLNLYPSPIVRQTSDGGYILLQGAVKDTSYGMDLLLIKLNAIGDTLWTKVIGGLTNDFAWGIQQTVDGGFIISTGTGCASGYGECDLLLVRTDSMGNLIWNKLIDVINNGMIHGIAHATAVPTFDGGFFVSTSGSQYNTFYFKTDSNGDTLWTHQYGGFTESLIKQTADSGFILTAYYGGSVYGTSFLRKINQFGITEWTRSYDTFYDWNIITTLNQTTDGGFILAESFGNQGYDRVAALIRTNEFGDTLWTHAYDSMFISSNCKIRFFSDIQPTSDGGFIAVADGSYGPLGEDFILKIDSMGIPLWSKNFSVGSVTTNPSTIQIANNGGFVISGIANDSLNGNRLSLIKTDTNLNSGCNNFGCLPLARIYSPDVYSSGLSNPYSAMFSLGSYPLISSSWDSVIDINTLCFSLDVENIEIESKLLVYPNPGNGIFNLQLNNKNNEQVSITVFDVTGRIIFEKDFGKPGELFNESIDLGNAIDGIYLVKASIVNHTFSQKVIMQHNR